ncbi:TetR/AcrR family transcriptional regulator [uncultured Jatrophihabitans sp.]|uniref:TetR/AcrR family transcriptional regulator n=1 Tax=uncultured Jatrophihabitans sp. TaxID=1610747 RepID=UPI0035C9E8CF
MSAAAQLFTDRGVDVPLEDVARQAGVGIGTLYRHFPTRDALIEAVYRHEVETLCSGIDERIVADTEHPDRALEAWMGDLAAYVARKRGMAMALKAVLGADSALLTESHNRISSALGQLLDAAVAAGTVRADVDPNDLMRAVGGICMATDTPGWRDRTGRLVGLLMDGLRYGASGS